MSSAFMLSETIQRDEEVDPFLLHLLHPRADLGVGEAGDHQDQRRAAGGT